MGLLVRDKGILRVDGWSTRHPGFRASHLLLEFSVFFLSFQYFSEFKKKIKSVLHFVENKK